MAVSRDEMNRFDYTKSKPNRFAREFAKNAIVVVLDPDVAAVFPDPKRVNSLLRATIAALKRPGSRSRSPAAGANARHFNPTLDARRHVQRVVGRRRFGVYYRHDEGHRSGTG